MPPADEPSTPEQEALNLAARHAREQAERLATAERLLIEERDARRAGLERVLGALGRQPLPHLDVRVLEETAVDVAGELRRRYLDLRRRRDRA